MLAASGLAIAEPAATHTLSLAGMWRFSLEGEGRFSDRIRLPGTINDAGLGPLNTAKADLSGPYFRHAYTGPAWYEREIEIPDDWQNMRVSLFLERCRWQTTVWLDGREIGSQDSLSVPHQYELGVRLKPGKHRLMIRVDNTFKHDLGRFVSALKGGTWGNLNGIIGRIELQATPQVWMDSVQVYPDVAAKAATVKVRIGNVTGKSGQGELEVKGVRHRVSWRQDGGDAEFVVPFPNAGLWNEFSPEMQSLTMRMGEHETVAEFGMREIHTEGTRFAMNGRPVFLRGTLECSVWPLTGYPPTDVAAWKRIYGILKAHGLNHMRFHSWCPPEAAFTAADEEGILLQVEGPCANVTAGKDAARDAFLVEELRRIVDTYGNHPSFCLMSPGNEFGGKNELLAGWVQTLRDRDPRRLYTSPCYGEVTANRQFIVTVKGRGIQGAKTSHDASKDVAREPTPIICHEIGQWTYWPDPAEASKWTGVMRLKNYELVHEDLKRKGLADLEPKYIQACGKFSTLLYKEVIEVLLRTPGYGGYQLLDLHDYPTQGTALIGPLDAFWDSKGFISADGFRRFSGPTVPLLRMPKRTYRSNEPFKARMDIAHHGPADLKAVEPEWTISGADGRMVAVGKLPACDVPAGKLSELGSIEVSFDGLEKAEKLMATVTVDGFSNDWEIWVYPPEPEMPPSPNIVECERWEDAKAALGEGRRVLFHAYNCDGEKTMKGIFRPVFWSPVWFPDAKPMTMSILCDPAHPLFEGFPTEMHSNWQWHDLKEKSRIFILDAAPTAYRPLVQVIDNFARNHRIGTIFEVKVGEGSLLVNGYDLRNMLQKPEARQLHSCLLHYLSSEAFRPNTVLSLQVLDDLFAEAKPETTEDSRH